MIVYGDHADRLAPRPELRRIGEALAAEGATADLFVDAAAITQGLIDAEFHARGDVDARSPLADALMEALTRLARALLGEAAPDAAAWLSLADAAPAAPVEARLAEGYAFYALHPAAYAAAARAAGLGPQTRLIGLRSIGTGLAAMAAAAAGAPPPVTVRPVGHPFARRLSLDPALAAEFGAAPAEVAVVDEGPGLSGSSFLATADALAALGVARGRLVLLASHPHGPGAQASPAGRSLWAEGRWSAADEVAPDDAAALAGDLTGPALAPVRDLSGGRWRSRALGGGAPWPAADLGKERRKLLVTTADGLFLLKWAGLGRDACAKLERARVLAEAGLSPPVMGLREGWLVQPWVEGRPLGPADPPPLAALAAALTLRAERFVAADGGGACIEVLAEMAGVNAGEALGDTAGLTARERVARGLAGPPPPRVWVDGRMHRHEWLAASDGRTLKTDAVDHARAHDLVGAQEIGWDVAGAAVEWDLGKAGVAALAAAAGAPPGRLPALRIAYLAFQLGSAAMAVEAHDGDERLRLTARRDRCAEALAALL